MSGHEPTGIDDAVDPHIAMGLAAGDRNRPLHAARWAVTTSASAPRPNPPPSFLSCGRVNPRSQFGGRSTRNDREIRLGGAGVRTDLMSSGAVTGWLPEWQVGGLSPRPRRGTMPCNTFRKPRGTKMSKVPISADSHIVEPPNCYVDYIDPAWRDRAPHIERNAKGVENFVIEGLKNTVPLGLLGGAGMTPEEVKVMRTADFDELVQGAWDPNARIEAQDRDGLGGEVIFASVGMVLCSHPDFDYKRACMTAYNRWLAEFCAEQPNRLFGLAQTAVTSVDEAIEDFSVAKEAGMVGMMVTGNPQHEDYDHPDYDALWECAVDLDLPVCFHILTSNDDDPSTALTSPRGHRANGFMNLVRGVQNILGVFVFGGVFERHPDLQMVVAEADAGWVPHWMYRSDHAALKWGRAMERTISKPPSEYVLSNCHFTFQDDATAYENSKLVDSDCLMWASDFPHTDSTYPRSQEVLAEHTGHLTQGQRDRVVHDNTVRVFNLALESAS
jgi:predicted TIM-barrel fold metal-dependent hydrolase